MKIENHHYWLICSLIAGLLMIGIAQYSLAPKMLDNKWDIIMGTYNTTIVKVDLCDFDINIVCYEETKFYRIENGLCNSKPEILIGEPYQMYTTYFAIETKRLKYDKIYCYPVSESELLPKTLFIIVNIIGSIFLVCSIIPLIYSIQNLRSYPINHNQFNRPIEIV